MGVLASLRQAPVEPVNCIEAAARFLAFEPGAAERLLVTHRRCDDGRCAACGMRSGQWPCGPASSALLALDRQGGRQGLPAYSTAPTRGDLDRKA
jgi:hypothetical protein